MRSCRSILDTSSVEGVTNANTIFDLAVAVLYFICNFGLLYWIYRQRRNAGQGNKIALKSIIFPVYMRILLLLGLLNIIVGLLGIFYEKYPKYHHTESDNDSESTPLHVKIVYSFTFAAQHFILEGIALMLLQRGCGNYAAKTAYKYSAAWTVVCFASFYSGFSSKPWVADGGFYLWNVAIMLFYFTIWLSPESWFYRRPASIKYAKYWCVFRMAYFGCLLLEDEGNRVDSVTLEEVGACGDLVLGYALFPIMLPVVVYWTFLQDSKWWQGLGQERVEAVSVDFSDDDFSDGYTVSSYFGDPRFQHERANETIESAHALGRKIDQIEGKNKVDFINFALLHLNTTVGKDGAQLLGEGSFSKVFRGFHKQRACAVKLISTRDLTVLEINKVAAEATLLSLIKGPNVVEIFGITVLPPRVGIVLELCTFGSLSDLLRGGGPDQYGNFPLSFATPQAPFLRMGHGFSSSSGFSGNSSFGSSGTNNSCGSFIPLSLVDRMYLALGCAKGLMALHTFSRRHCLVHRDIKSFNFLVDSQLNAKLSDLEMSSDSHPKSNDTASATESPSPRNFEGKSPDRRNRYSSTGTAMSTLFNNKSVDGQDSYDVNSMLANWIAPEVLRGEPFTQAADVYSLALVLWEIITNKVPYASTKVQSKFSLRDLIIHGHRHDIPANLCPTPYQDLIRAGWEENPDKRPTASDMVDALTTVWSRCRTPELDGGGSKTVQSFFYKLNRVLDDSAGVSGSTLRLSDFICEESTVAPEDLSTSTTRHSQILCQLKEELDVFHKEIRSMEQHVYVDGNLVKKSEALKARFRLQQESEADAAKSFSTTCCARCRSCSCFRACYSSQSVGRDTFSSSGSVQDVKSPESSDNRFFHPLSTMDTDSFSPFYNMTYPMTKPNAKSSRYFELISLHAMFEAKPSVWNPIRDCREPVLLLSGRAPHVIATCSIAFEKLLGFTSHQLFGKCLEHILDINCYNNCAKLEEFYQSIQRSDESFSSSNDDSENSTSVLSGISSPPPLISSPHSTSSQQQRKLYDQQRRRALPDHTGHVVLTLLDARARLQEYSIHAVPVYARPESSPVKTDSRRRASHTSDMTIISRSVDSSTMPPDSAGDETSRRLSMGSILSDGSSGYGYTGRNSEQTSSVLYYTVTLNSLAKVPLIRRQLERVSEVSGDDDNEISNSPWRRRSSTSSVPKSGRYPPVKSRDRDSFARKNTVSNKSTSSLGNLLLKVLPGRGRSASNTSAPATAHTSDSDRFSDVVYESAEQQELYESDYNYYENYDFTDV